MEKINFNKKIIIIIKKKMDLRQPIFSQHGSTIGSLFM